MSHKAQSDCFRLTGSSSLSHPCCLALCSFSRFKLPALSLSASAALILLVLNRIKLENGFEELQSLHDSGELHSRERAATLKSDLDFAVDNAAETAATLEIERCRVEELEAEMSGESTHGETT